MIPNTNQIEMYFVCKNCFPEKPADVAPRDWARINVGWTKLGFQVWCVRCDCNIVHIDFEGNQHPANITREAEPHERTN